MESVQRILFTGIVAATGLAAVEPPATLEQALRIAASESTDGAVSRARLERVRTLDAQAQALLMPTATLTTGVGKQWSSNLPYQGPSTTAYNGGATVDIRVLNLSAFPALEVAHLRIAAQERSSSDLRRTVAYAVSAAWLDVLAAERQVAVANQRRTVANQLQREAEARLKAGLAVASDVHRAAVEVADSELAVTQANRAVEVARLAVQEAVGGQEAAPAISEPQIQPPAETGPDTLIAAALQRRDDLAAASIGIEATDRQREVIRRQGWPIVSLRAGASSATYDPTPKIGNSDPTWSVGLQATWQLYDGGMIDAQIEENSGQVREQTAQRRAAELAVRRAIRSALADVRTVAISIVQAEARQKAADADAGDSLARYRAGTGTASELADAQYRAAAAAAELSRQQIARLVAHLSLRRALGLWPLTEGEP